MILKNILILVLISLTNPVEANVFESSPCPFLDDRLKHEELRDWFDLVDRVQSSFKNEEDAISPVAWRRATAREGLPGVDLPAEYGGKGLSPSETAAIFQHAGTYSLNLRDVVGGAHVRPLMHSQHPEVREIVKQVARGDGYVAIAITEPEFGSNMRGMTSFAEKTEGGYLLTGHKRYNARFETASHIILFVQAPGQRGRSGVLSTYVVPKDHPGLEFETIKARGLYGNSFGGVRFEKMFVPEKYRLGNDGEGTKIFREHFTYWRIMQSAAAIGTGKGALLQARDRMLGREAFGAPIARFTHLQQELAQLTFKIYSASLVLEQATRLLDAGRYQEAEVFAAMIKAEGVEAALEASDFAMRVFGAAGYSGEVDVGQRVADLQGLRIADGTTDVLRQDYLRKIFGEEFWNLAVTPNWGGEKAERSASGKEESVKDLVERLRRERAEFAENEDFTGCIRAGGGGACATTTAFNLLQLAVAAAGREPLGARTAVEQFFERFPELTAGRVTNEQIVRLVESFGDYLPGYRFETTLLSATGEPMDSNGTYASVWKGDSFDWNALSDKPGEFNIIIFNVAVRDGKFLGRHFVVQKSRDGEDLVSVLDPNNTTEDYTYALTKERIKDGGDSITLSRPGYASRNLRTVAAILKVRLRPEE